MPTLSIFSLSFLVSLLLFHSQVELPWLWQQIHDQWGGLAAVYLAWAVVLPLLVCQGGICHDKKGIVVWIILGMGTAQLSAGLQATAHTNLQVPLDCNKQAIESTFRLIEKGFRDEDAQTWLIEHVPPTFAAPTACLLPGARLQLFIENSGTYTQILPGQLIRTRLRLKPPRAALQLEGFDVHRHWFANRIAGTAQLKGGIEQVEAELPINPIFAMERARLNIANWIITTLDSHPEKPLVLAMVVGDQGLISPEDRDLFNNTGIAHLVAISGLHITLFAMLAGKLMGSCWRRSARLCLRIPAPLAGSAFGLVFAVLYGLIAGWGVPAQRTVFMLLALFIGQMRGGLQSSWDTFFLALFLTLAFDNWAVLDAGFILSFGAVATLIFVTQGHYHFIKPRHEFIANAVKAQYTVTVGLILPCAILFNQQSLVSPLANALSIPWMSFISTPLALLGGLLQQTWAVLLAAESLSLQRTWLSALNELGWATMPIHMQPWWINSLVGLGCVVLILPPGIISRWIGVGLIALLAWPADRPVENDFWMTLMDVGQGTAIAIQTQNHLLVYDAGPAFNARSNSARRVLLPWMAHHGYARADMFMLSHDDADHSGGAPLYIEKSPPAEFASSVHEDHALNTFALKQKSTIANCHTMQSWRWDGVLFEPLAIHQHGPFHKKLFAKNNQSCVLKISNTKHSVLLTGDIEAISEMHLLVQHGAEKLKARVLVVPHHGSKTSSTLPFLQAVRPEIALIQSGWGNQFGHPHGQVLERYQLLNVEVRNTAQIGAMRWEFPHAQTNPSAAEARTERQRYWHMHESGAKPR
mgnify:CR=1 FL=1